MLNKKPRGRITIQQIKQHAFFRGFDWQLLLDKKVSPPVHLVKNEEDSNASDLLKGADDEEQAFLNAANALTNEGDTVDEAEMF